jgi:hypothetical protein
MDEVEPVDDLAVRPTTAKVRFPVKAIIEGTCKVERQQYT